MTQPIDQLSYVNSVWIQDLLSFMYNYNIKLYMEQFFTPKNQRENDKCIMNELIKLDLTKTEMIKLNACRMYLQVLQLRDIEPPDGKEI